MLFILKILFWRRSGVKILWDVCDFMNYLTRSFLYGLFPLVKLWHCLWTSVSRTCQNRISRWQTTRRLLCGKLQGWTLSRDVHIFLRNFNVGLKMFGNVEEWVEIRTRTTCCLWDIKAMETPVKHSFLKIRMVENASRGSNHIMVRRGMFGKVHDHGVKEID